MREKCFFFQGKEGKFSLLGGEMFLGWRTEGKIPCGEGEMFLFSEREGNVLLALAGGGGGDGSVAGEKRC